MIKGTKTGFTFIELIIVIAIIGILSGLFVTQYPATQRRARDTERRSDIKQYQTAMESYANRNNGNYFSASGNLVNQCATLNLSTCPDDSDTSLHYLITSTTSQYVLSARLEQPQNPVTSYYVCSNGNVGDHISVPVPATAVCPL